MLNPFPIQWLALLAYFILRLFVGVILLRLGLVHLRYRHELKHVLRLSWFPFGYFTTIVFALSELILSFMFLAGFYTQIAALVAMAMSIKLLIMRTWFAHHTIPSKLFYFMLLGVSISLFITGAGALAFDLPI